jgi:hypothetical protein
MTAALTALIAVALVVLIVKSIPAAADHKGQIHAAGYGVTTCAIQAQRRDDTGLQTLAHIADCIQENHQVRTESGDLTLTMLSLTLVGAGGWQLIHRRHH